MKNKNKIFMGLVFLLVFIFASPPPVAHADMGPKPSVVVDFKGVEGEKYYVTLLSERSSTGPHTAAKKNEYGEIIEENLRYSMGDEGYDVFIKFLNYNDTDGYYFLQFFSECTNSHQFKWTYYPPKKFKILVYFPESDSFMTGQILNTYAFDSYYTAEIQKDQIISGESSNSLAAKKSYNYLGEAFSLIIRIALTIAVELAIALLFTFSSKKRFLFITIVNAATQILLNVTLNIINFKMGQLVLVIFYVLLEILIFIIEAVLFSIYLKKLEGPPIKSWKPPLYALISNTASFALGLALVVIMPGIF